MKESMTNVEAIFPKRPVKSVFSSVRRNLPFDMVSSLPTLLYYWNSEKNVFIWEMFHHEKKPWILFLSLRVDCCIQAH